MNPFIDLVFSATAGLSCNLTIDQQHQSWRISADVDAQQYTGRSQDKTVTKHLAMMTVQAGFPDTSPWTSIPSCSISK